VRAYLPQYEMKSPKNLLEALKILKDEENVWMPFAGGTDLMVLFEAGKLSHDRFLNLLELNELKGISITPDTVTLGALTTYTEIQNHPLLQKEFPLLCQAAFETGAVAIQNRGTLGGNIVNASPAADSPPALLVYDARLELISVLGSRWVDYAAFHTGYKKTLLMRGELLARIELPRKILACVGFASSKSSNGYFQYYKKVGTRKAQAISKTCFAGILKKEGKQIIDIRIALGSVAPTVIRCKKTESFLIGKLISPQTIEKSKQILSQEIAPIDDLRSTQAYRMQVTANLLESFLSR